MYQDKYHLPLEPEGIYHVFNHAISNENLFLIEENYNFFLRKYSLFINPVADTYAYCLLPNHFHLAVKFKSKEEILSYYNALMKEEDTAAQKFNTFEKFLSKQFSKLFSSYTQSFNKVNKRKGSLFVQQFKRLKVENEKQFQNLIHYIHYNPIKHDFEQGMNWKHSSYHAYVSEKATSLKREDGFHLFENKQEFISTHSTKPNFAIALGMDF